MTWVASGHPVSVAPGTALPGLANVIPNNDLTPLENGDGGKVLEISVASDPAAV